jgi:hypothetical protein
MTRPSATIQAEPTNADDRVEPRAGYTVADVAARYRVSPDKVRAWIDRGELAAVNTAANLCGRPRYVITPQALAAFEQGQRAAGPKPQQTRGRKPRVPEVFYRRR